MSTDRGKHYGEGAYEPRHVIREWGLSFALGNVLKYVQRAGNKPGEARADALQKAMDYLQDEMDATQGPMEGE